MGKRRGRGEGAVYEEAGRWVAVVSLGSDGTGRRIRRKVRGATKEAVLAELRKLQTQRDAGSLRHAERLTVGEWLTQWMGDTENRLRSTTHRRYRVIVENHLQPRLGNVRLDALTGLHVQRMLTDMRKDEATARTIQMTYAVLRVALDAAKELRLVMSNVTHDVKRPRYETAAVEVFSDDEVARMFAAAKSMRCNALLHLAVASGLRQGELFALQWRDVSFTRDEQGHIIGASVEVQRTISQVTGEAEPTKSRAGKRRVEVDAHTAAILHAHREVLQAEHAAKRSKKPVPPWVFPSMQGHAQQARNFMRREWAPLIEAAEIKLEGRTFHTLRHTAASIMLRNSTHPKVVQERLGHATIKITLDTYSHLMPSMQREAADAMGRFLVGLSSRK